MMKIDSRNVSVTDVCEAVIIKQDGLATGVFNMTEQAFSLARTWLRRASTRAELRNLDPRLLNDVGLSRQQAREEVDKSFWV
jgi:uncharacterized protein YjiS (DUF1127 family)